jgi:hypothetical protein
VIYAAGIGGLLRELELNAEEEPEYPGQKNPEYKNEARHARRARDTSRRPVKDLNKSMEKSEFGFGVVGTGVIAGVVADAILKSQNAQLIAVSSRQIEKRARFRDQPPRGGGGSRRSYVA